MVRDNIVNQNLCELCKDEKSQEHRNGSSYNTCRQLKITEFLKESSCLKPNEKQMEEERTNGKLEQIYTYSRQQKKKSGDSLQLNPII